MQLSMQMQKGSKGDGTFVYMTEEQFEQLKNSDFVEQAGHRRTIGYADVYKRQSLRKAKGLTQNQLGERLNISFQAVSKWERGVSHS